MWVLIWTIWLEKGAITTWEGKNPQHTLQKCLQLGEIKKKAFEKVSYYCKYYTVQELFQILKKEKEKQLNQKSNSKNFI
jgi:hypothetical protein